MCVHLLVWGGHRFDTGLFLHHPAPYFSLSLNLELTNLAKPAEQPSSDPSVFTNPAFPPNARVIDCHLWL